MKEIGGYIELDKYYFRSMHENAIALNSGRNCLAFLIEKKSIKNIYLPKFVCNSIIQVCKERNVNIKYYSIGIDFCPNPIDCKENEWVYVINYYGRISNDKIYEFKLMYNNLIIDNTQAFFQEPCEGVNTLYTCRKFFGVPDGAYLYTDEQLDEGIERDCSLARMTHILGRYEKTASEFYKEFVRAERTLDNRPIMKMSKLTENMLCAIDYEKVRNRRKENYQYLNNRLKDINRLKMVSVDGAFMYPLYLENGSEIRKKLHKEKIYVPVLWPDVFNICNESELEYDMALNIVPLPVDQRYGIEDLEYMVKILYWFV